MSAWNPPQASVRCHRAGSAPRKGVNFLRRLSDKFESWFRGFLTLVLVLVLGLPVAALGAGLTVRVVDAHRADAVGRAAPGAAPVGWPVPPVT